MLGKLTCDGGQLLLPRSGSFDLPEGLQPPCSAVLFDGQDVVSVLLSRLRPWPELHFRG